MRQAACPSVISARSILHGVIARIEAVFEAVMGGRVHRVTPGRLEGFNLEIGDGVKANERERRGCGIGRPLLRTADRHDQGRGEDCRQPPA